VIVALKTLKAKAYQGQMVRPRKSDSERRDSVPLRIRLSLIERAAIEEHLRALNRESDFKITTAPWARDLLVGVAAGELKVSKVKKR